MTIVNKAAMTQEKSKPVVSRSRFPLNQRIAGGYRFGLYQPCFVEDYNPNETIPVKSAHDVRSMNLKSPMFGNVSIHKDYFDVPFTVLLPFNYEKLFVQPSVGDDVDASEVGMNVKELPYKLSQMLEHYYSLINDEKDSIIADLSDEEVEVTAVRVSHLIELYVQYINFISLTFSSGSLFSSLGEDLSGLVLTDSNNHIDIIIDSLWANFFDFITALIEYYSSSLNNANAWYVSIDNQPFYLDPDLEFSTDSSVIGRRQFIERSYDASHLSFFDPDSFDVLDDTVAPALDFVAPADFTFTSLSALKKDLRLDKLYAYQVVCSEFYTNSRVDYMYSAQLFRQFVSAFLFDDEDGFNLTRTTFTWNGVDYQYDYLSAHNFNAAYTAFMEVENVETLTNLYQFYRLLFGYNRSLRYVDYFTGARPRPYPVLGVSTPVVDGSVRVVDSIRQNWFAKFINQAYRAGRKLSEYTKAMFAGVSVKRDYHDPMWLGSISDMVETPETSNTGAAQQSQSNSVSSNFVSNGNRYAFEYDTPQFYGVVIGILHFDIARYYPHVIERTNFNVDRNDFFNPYLQLVGDQPVYQDELFSGSTHDTFGYTGRNMEYKTKVDRCFGIFSMGDYLPGWLYVAPDAESLRGNLVQNPSYIRAYPSELDRFFTSLVGYSPATYYHFLIVNTNDVNISREMIANPSLD